MLWATLLGGAAKWFVGDGISALANAYAKTKDAQTEQDKVRADVLAKQLDAALEAQRLALQVRTATAGFWEMRLLTFVIASCFVLHLVAVTIDTVFTLRIGIPAYPKPFDAWEAEILLSFFGLQAVGKGVTLAAAFLAKR